MRQQIAFRVLQASLEPEAGMVDATRGSKAKIVLGDGYVFHEWKVFDSLEYGCLVRQRHTNHGSFERQG